MSGNLRKFDNRDGTNRNPNRLGMSAHRPAAATLLIGRALLFREGRQDPSQHRIAGFALKSAARLEAIASPPTRLT
jgi:hypothetical protein